MQSIFLSKTFWFNAIMILIDVAAFLEVMFPANQDLLFALGLIHGIGNIVLRRFTSTPVGFSLPEVK